MNDSPLFWHLACAVPDLDASCAELGRVLGLQWRPARDVLVDGVHVRLTMSEQGPPYIEVVQGGPGSPWHAAGGGQLDHIGYWVDDLDEERRRLEAAGAPVLWDGQARSAPSNMHYLPASGVRIEPVQASHRPAIEEGWGITAVDDRHPLSGSEPYADLPVLMWQLSMVVPDIDLALAELAGALRVSWRETLALTLGGHELRVALSVEGPPFLEMCEGSPGSPWDPMGGPRIDHIAYFAEDEDAERSRLESAGAPVVWDGRANGGVLDYHELPASGFRIESAGRRRMPEVLTYLGGIPSLETLLPFGRSDSLGQPASQKPTSRKDET